MTTHFVVAYDGRWKRRGWPSPVTHLYGQLTKDGKFTAQNGLKFPATQAYVVNHTPPLN